MSKFGRVSLSISFAVFDFVVERKKLQMSEGWLSFFLTDSELFLAQKYEENIFNIVMLNI